MFYNGNFMFYNIKKLGSGGAIQKRLRNSAPNSSPSRSSLTLGKSSKNLPFPGIGTLLKNN